MDTSDPNFSSAKAEMLRWQLFLCARHECNLKGESPELAR